ncbi:WHG domain-containing protein [Nocardiopsis sp. CNT-189]
MLARAEALRPWPPANPQGFRLIYGDPVPGYRPPEGGPAAEAERRACAGLTGLVAAARPAGNHPVGGSAWSDPDADPAGHVREESPDRRRTRWPAPCASGGGCTACSPWRSMAAWARSSPPREGSTGGDAGPGPLAGARGARSGGGLTPAGRLLPRAGRFPRYAWGLR